MTTSDKPIQVKIGTTGRSVRLEIGEAMVDLNIMSAIEVLGSIAQAIKLSGDYIVEQEKLKKDPTSSEKIWIPGA